MTEHERMQKIFHDPEEPINVCLYCEHFYRHYLQRGMHSYTPAHFGHCVYPRLKFKKAYDTCSNFERRPP